MISYNDIPILSTSPGTNAPIRINKDTHATLDSSANTRALCRDACRDIKSGGIDGTNIEEFQDNNGVSHVCSSITTPSCSGMGDNGQTIYPKFVYGQVGKHLANSKNVVGY